MRAFFRAIRLRDLQRVEAMLLEQNFSKNYHCFNVPAQQWAQWAFPQAVANPRPQNPNDIVIRVDHSPNNVFANQSHNSAACYQQFGFLHLTHQYIQSLNMAQFLVAYLKTQHYIYAKSFFNTSSTYLQAQLATLPSSALALRKLASPFGYGVFTLQAMRKDQAITEYLGQVQCRHKTSDQGDTSYVMEYPIPSWLGWRWTIDAKHFGNIARFINHSQQPNSEIRIFYDGQILRLAVVALRAVASGEQICMHYGSNYWSSRQRQTMP